MRVADLKREALLKEQQTKQIYNPDTEDFTVAYSGKFYTIPATQIATFPTVIADHIQRHLAIHILNKRGVKTNYEDDLAKIYEEIKI